MSGQLLFNLFVIGSFILTNLLYQHTLRHQRQTLRQTDELLTSFSVSAETATGVLHVLSAENRQLHDELLRMKGGETELKRQYRPYVICPN